jgi:glucokinase
MEKRYLIGIDVGGTNLKAGVTDRDGRLLAVRRTPLGAFRGPEAFAADLAALAAQAAQAAGTAPESVESVGIGIPGAVAEGKILFTTNIPMENVPLAELFAAHFPSPVLLGNDADCAAVGEYCCGAGRGTRNFIVVTLGTGVGGGLILNGRLYSGMGAAGEVGHILLEPEGELCNCGRRGCWERYASATGLIRMTREAMEAHPESLLHAAAQRSGSVDGRTAFQAAGQGDPAALALCERYAAYVAAGVVDLLNILHPEVLALGGGVAAAPEELLLEPVRRIAERESFGRHCGRITRIVRAELGNDAGIIGAAMLCRVR